MPEKKNHFLSNIKGWVFTIQLLIPLQRLAWLLGMSCCAYFLAEFIKPKTIGAFQQNQQPFLKNNGIE
jgi:hypothetical protein